MLKLKESAFSCALMAWSGLSKWAAVDLSQRVCQYSLIQMPPALEHLAAHPTRHGWGQREVASEESMRYLGKEEQSKISKGSRGVCATRAEQ